MIKESCECSREYFAIGQISNFRVWSDGFPWLKRKVRGLASPVANFRGRLAFKYISKLAATKAHNDGVSTGPRAYKEDIVVSTTHVGLFCQKIICLVAAVFHRMIRSISVFESS
jgi:hypothetical protein